MLILLLCALAFADPPSGASAQITITATVVGPCADQTVPGALEVCGIVKSVEVPAAVDAVKAGAVPDAQGFVNVNP